MNKTKRLRRVGILCCHFTRNFAYYKAGSECEQPERREQFWLSVNSNFIDISVLEWRSEEHTSELQSH